MKLVIVEDDYFQSHTLKTILEENNYKVLGQYASGEDMLKNHSSHSEVDILLLDINLGRGMSGIEVAQKVREASSTPIAFISAQSDSKSMEAINSINHSVLINKPIDYSLLTSELTKLYTMNQS